MKIEFIPYNKEVELTVPMPTPATNALPEWYKKIPRFANGDAPIFNNGRVENNTVKACVPFRDALTHGYIQKTWCDISINLNDDKIEWQFPRSPHPFSAREGTSIAISEEFYNVEFSWTVPWFPKLPPGWSILITSPLNRIDLPFYSSSAIIDVDNFYHVVGGNYPFYIKKNIDRVIIPSGTPMYQMIPIKRESWQSDFKQFSEDEYMINYNKFKSYFIGAYKRFFHEKKSFR